MKTIYVVSAVLVGCAYIFTYTEACCHKELVLGLSGLGCPGLLAPSHCGCGCDCDLCLPALPLHGSSCGCDHCAPPPTCGCGGGCGCVNLSIKKIKKKKKKTIIKEIC